MISVSQLSKTYVRDGGAAVNALKNVSLEIQSGEFIAIRGPSGSGKSSLLNILGCLDTPSEGRYLLAGEDVSCYSDRQLAGVRSRKIGFVFQSFHLLPRTTAVENVELPMVYGNGRVDRKKALSALERVGLAHRAHHYGSELSGGEQQRVAIARALINDPPLILADEPTGNLDAASGGEALAILEALNAEGRTVVLITHDDAVASRASRQISLRDGVME